MSKIPQSCPLIDKVIRGVNEATRLIKSAEGRCEQESVTDEMYEARSNLDDIENLMEEIREIATQLRDRSDERDSFEDIFSEIRRIMP